MGSFLARPVGVENGKVIKSHLSGWPGPRSRFGNMFFYPGGLICGVPSSADDHGDPMP